MDPNVALQELKDAKADRVVPWLIRQMRQDLHDRVARYGLEPSDPNWRSV